MNENAHRHAEPPTPTGKPKPRKKGFVGVIAGMLIGWLLGWPQGFLADMAATSALREAYGPTASLESPGEHSWTDPDLSNYVGKSPERPYLISVKFKGVPAKYEAQIIKRDLGF